MFLPIVTRVHDSIKAYENVKKTVKSLTGRKLGSGVSSIAYAKKGTSNRVIKIGADEGYAKWVKAIGLRSKNPHFPKIYSYTRHFCEQNDEELHVVEIERLIEYHDVPEKIRRNLFIKMGCNDLCDERDLEGGQWFAPTDDHGKQLKRMLKKLNAYDTHEGNIMFRKKGRGYQLVVTDPLCI